MRRLCVVLFSVIVVLGSLVVGGGALAAQDADIAGHPLIGAWELVADVGAGEEPCTSQVLFTDEGGYVDVDCEGIVVIGAWEPTGDSTAILTITSTDPDGFTATIRAELEVDTDGQSFTGSFTFEPIDPESGESMGEYGPGMASGTRLVAEAPGTPEGSIMDLFSQFEGPEEATPAG
jgi:hypothetical protein